jgi:DNA-binding MarR family transcriptional regulator
LSLEMGIAKMLRELTRVYNENSSKRIKDTGITPPQLMALYQIYKEPKTIGQIVDALHLSYSTVSGIVDRLERDGWLERVRDKQDRRVTWISKTEKLQARAEENHLFHEAFYSEFLRELPEEELRMIKRSVELITSYMEKKVEDKS